MQNNEALKPAFYLENERISNVDFSEPFLGNPGCGGTEYLFVATPYYLQKHLPDLCRPILLANDTSHLPIQIESHKVQNVHDALCKAKELGADLFVYRPRRDKEDDILELIDKLEMPTIAWAHITPKNKYLREMAETRFLKTLVCVEHEQYDQIQDTLLSAVKKTTFIVNGFDVDQFLPPNVVKKDDLLVVYLGALVPNKGFHILAKVWPRIIKRVPDAKLTVIGTGALYERNAKLGSWQVAEASYEEKCIIPFLGDDQGGVHPSVTFAGKLGVEKKNILHRALIGVPNPTGITENCPGSALEFQACGTAVVSGAYWGILDTVNDKVTGLLGKTEQDLEDNICNLLENPQKAYSLGMNGVGFVKERYCWEKVVQQWLLLFQDIQQSSPPKRIAFKVNYKAHHKWLILLNRFFQLLLGRLIFWPSVTELKQFVYQKFFRR